jgi:hypothetical protein
MTQPQPMPSARRRPIAGMAGQVLAPQAPTPTSGPAEAEAPLPAASAPTAAGKSRKGTSGRSSRDGEQQSRDPSSARGNSVRQRQPAADYGTTRLANFRLPVDLHDRYKRLVREVEEHHPRLRNPSVTEVVIALLEEGPGTVHEVAELIRRKRAAEHAEGA